MYRRRRRKGTGIIIAQLMLLYDLPNCQLSLYFVLSYRRAPVYRIASFYKTSLSN